MVPRSAAWIMVSCLVLACAVVVALEEQAGSETRPLRAVRPAKQHPATVTPDLRRVAYAFLRTLASRDRAATRKLIDPTYPCGPFGAAKRDHKIWFVPLARGYSRNDVTFEGPSTWRDRLGFRVLIDSDRGAHGDFVIVLERHGNRWLVSYFDKRLAPLGPQLCDGFVHSN